MKKLLLILLCLPLLFGCGNNGVKEGVIERTTSYGGKCFDTYDDYKIVSTVCYYHNGVKKFEKFANEEAHYDKYGRLRIKYFKRNDMIDLYSSEYAHNAGLEPNLKKLEEVWVEEHYYRTGERRLCVSLAGTNETFGGRGKMIGERTYWDRNGKIIIKGDFGYGIQWEKTPPGKSHKDKFISKHSESLQEIENDSRWVNSRKWKKLEQYY